MEKYLKIASALLGFLLITFLTMQFSARVDFTEGQIYTLSDSTIQLLSSLSEEVKVKVFISENLPSLAQSNKKRLMDYLREYEKHAGSSLVIEYLDPSRNDDARELALKLGVPEVQMQVVEKDKAQVVNVFMGLAVVKEAIDPKEGEDEYEKIESLPLVQNFSNFEYDLSSAIFRVNSKSEKVLAFYKGKGSKELMLPRSMRSYASANEATYDLRESLEKTYQVKELELAEESELDGVDTLIIPGVKEEFSAEEINKIHEFNASGGNLIILQDVTSVSPQLQASLNPSNQDALLSKWGVSVVKSLVRDNLSANASFNQGFFSFSLPYPYFVKSTNFPSNSVLTQRIKSMVFPWSSYLEIDEKEGYQYDILATSSARYSLASAEVEVQEKASVDGEEGETDITTLKEQFINLNPQQDFEISDDKKEALALSVLVKSKSEEGQVLIVSDADFLDANFISDNPGNKIFFMNAVDSMTIGDDLISIRSKAINDYPLGEISETKKELIKWVNVIFVPLGFALFGIARMYFRNRRKFT